MADLPRPPGFQGRLLNDDRTRAAYSEGAGPYRILPRAVAFPMDRDDVAALVRYAAAEGLPLTARGAGSGMPGGNVGHGIVVDLRALDRPCRVSLASSANVGTAVTWQTLDQVASHFGYRLPPDPSSGAFCTLGGMVATNAAGARSLMHGSIRRWVKGVEIITADGEAGWLGRRAAERALRGATPRTLVARLRAEDRFEPVAQALRAASPEVAARFPSTTKNAAGYALDAWLASGELVDLVIGSEGTLGIVTRVELDLAARPGAVGTALMGLGSPDDLAPLLPALLALEPAALEFLDGSYLAFTGDDAPIDTAGLAGALLIEFEAADRSQIGERLSAVRTVAADAPLCETALDGEAREALWALRHAASPRLASLPDNRRSLQIIEDGCVPVPALSRYLAGVHDAARRAGTEIIVFGHAGDGHLHVNVLVDPADPTLPERLDALWQEVTGLVADLGGTASGEHGDGRLRASALERIYGQEIVSLFDRVKAAFDPAGILNPGVIVGSESPPVSRLKVGPAAAPIAPDVAARLRDMERTGGWGQPPHTPTEGPA